MIIIRIRTGFKQKRNSEIDGYWYLSVDLGPGCEYLGVGPLVPRVNLHGVGVDAGRLLQIVELGRSDKHNTAYQILVLIRTLMK